MTSTWMKSAMALFGALTLVACGEAQVDLAANTDEFIDDELSTRAASYVTLKKDLRRCAAPACGGWFVKDVNKTTAAQYVASLDFSTSGIDAAGEAQLAGAADGEVVMLGKLGLKSRRTGQRLFLVGKAWRGMPGRTAQAGDSFYVLTDRRPFVRCIQAPCNALEAGKLNLTTKTQTTDLSVASAAGNYVDETWLNHEALTEEGIVAASIQSGARFPGGTEKIVDASQVFVKVPETRSCPQMRLAPCAAGNSWTYRRDENRCVLPIGCAPTVACRKLTPACEAGYELIQWTGESGCSEYACDPSWSRN